MRTAPVYGAKVLFYPGLYRSAWTSGGEIDTVVDLFGGSGLLSHTAKKVLPGVKVVYNDFDGYSNRLGAVESTNEI